MLNTSRIRALEILAEGPLTEADRETVALQIRTLWGLSKLGLVKYYPNGRDPAWKLTDAGRKEYKRILNAPRFANLPRKG